jgi:hypothetical protein
MPTLATEGYEMEMVEKDVASMANFSGLIPRRAFLAGAGAMALLAASKASVALADSPSFVHPGLLHTQADFDRMYQKVAAGISPWIDSWNKLIANSYASTSWTPSPKAIIYRNYPGQSDNYISLDQDVAAAYANALRWKIQGDTAAADTAVRIMNAWSATLTQIAITNGHYDGLLVAGIQGYQFANAGEIMRSYSGWAAADFASFQNMMLNVFYPLNQGVTDVSIASSLLVYSNWQLSAMCMVLAVGVLCDSPTIFNQAVTYFKGGLGNGAIAQMTYYIHPGYLGQTQESGRDQGHDTLSISLVSTLCEMAWNQGVDLYGYDNNRVLAGCEYVAKGNLIQSGSTYFSVPFATYKNQSVTDTVFATGGQGNVRPEWALIYNHYVNRRGIAAPYSQMFAQLISPEGGAGNYGTNSGGFDQLGYGTLTCTRDAISAGAVPSGLTAVTIGGAIVLSWWGTAYATSYNIYRSTTSGHSYALIASGITDLLTYTDSSVSSGTYYYVVTAVTSSGETAASNEATGVAGTLIDTYLAFDEGTGTTATDSTGYGHTGTLNGGASWAAGKYGYAVSLNGSSGYVSLPTGVADGIGDFTIAAWVYWNGNQTWARIFDIGSNTNRYMYLTPRSGSNVVRFAMTLTGSYGEQSIVGTAALPSSAWVHVAVTLSGTTGTLYVNGTAVGTNSSMSFSPFRLGSTTQNWLGRSQYSGDAYFNGKIDDFRIYGGALSAAQIAALAAA